MIVLLIVRQLYIGPYSMGCYPCTIKRETFFYQPKQGYPHDCCIALILQKEILRNTLCPDISMHVLAHIVCLDL